MNKYRDYELSVEEIAAIHAYLYGELSSSEWEAFEHRTAADSEWRDKVEEVRYLNLGVQEANLGKELEKWKADLLLDNQKVTRPIQTPLYRWWLAASIVLAVMASIWIFGTDADTPEQLYQAFYEQDIGLPVQMSASEEGRYHFYDGMISYKEGNYTDALTKWEGIETEVISSDTLAYYRAMAHMGQGDFSVAAKLLDGLVSEDHSAFHTDAIWYLALSYLGQGDKEGAVFKLKEIPQDERAQQLLNRMK